VALKAGAAGVVTLLLLLGAVYALATRSSGSGSPSTEPSIATIVAGGSQLRTPVETTPPPGTTAEVAGDATPVELPTEPVSADPPANATELASGSYGMVRDSSGFQLSDTFQKLSCVADNLIELQTAKARYLIQIPVFPGYNCESAMESLERSRSVAGSPNPAVGLEYLRAAEGRSSQVLIGWESGASNTLAVQGVYQPS